MILADSSVWIDHIRATNSILFDALDDNNVLGHSMVLGEVMMGSLARREETIGLLAGIPQAAQASHREVITMVERERLFGLGLGYIDAHLLAATRLTSDARLWTRDKRLHDAAARLGVAFSPAH